MVPAIANAEVAPATSSRGFPQTLVIPTESKAVPIAASAAVRSASVLSLRLGATTAFGLLPLGIDFSSRVSTLVTTYDPPLRFWGLTIRLYLSKPIEH